MKRIFAKNALGLFFAGLLFGLAPSCDYSYFEVEQLPDYTYQPVFALPLVHSSFTISDLLPDSAGNILVVGEDNLISLVYNNCLGTAYGTQLFYFPDRQYQTDFSASPPEKNSSQTFSQTFSFHSEFDDRLESVSFSEGMLAVYVSASNLHSDGLDATVTLTVSDSFDKTGQPFSMTLNADSFNQKSLTGYTFQFYSSGDEHNLFDINYELTFSGSGSSIHAPYHFHVDQDFQAMQLEKMIGVLEPRSLDLGDLNVDIDIFDAGFEGEIYFADPKIRFWTSNSFGFDIDVEVDNLILSNNNTDYPLTGFPNLWRIAGPDLDQMGQSVLSEFSLSKNNSNVANGVEINPVTLYSNISTQFNPEFKNAFVLDQSQFEIHMDFELPLNGTATGFSLKDTMELSNDDAIDEIEWIELALDVVNGIPLEFFLQIEFLDSLNQVLGVVFKDVEDYKLIESAQVDEQGNVIASERKSSRIMLDEDQIQAFFNSTQLILTARLSTADQGSKVVRIYNDQALEVQLSARIKGKVLVEF